jgi:D-tagatose-1,6-bisphosphate aldolase subunit GatZ/KbaZ
MAGVTVMTAASLQEIVAANRAGNHAGIPSYCTAHRETLQAILRFYQDNEHPILIEATCNQVNQDGGYTGMTPAGFRDFVHALADEARIDRGRIVLGGDHLGPNPWKVLSARDAMAKARDLVRAYVEAGFTKLHLDASMACGDDGELTEEEIADRAGDLAAMAETHSSGAALLYVVGTEVPKPGGETEALGGLAVTEPGAVLRTYELHRSAFMARGLSQALSRVIGIVVQPGVDFGNHQIFDFDKEKAVTLSAAIAGIPGAAFEAHSTDYQTPRALHDLVASHFAILKVGPELTAAYREAVVAMAAIEEWLPIQAKSGILDVIDRAMTADPKYWRDYVGDDSRARLDRLFGLSDRIRYYWPNAAIQKALRTLAENIDGASGEVGLIDQFAKLPEGRAGSGLPLSQQIVQARVGAVVAKYSRAC